MQSLGPIREMESIQKTPDYFLNYIVPTDKIAPHGERKKKGTHYGTTA
jgi:hypothetical protein